MAEAGDCLTAALTASSTARWIHFLIDACKKGPQQKHEYRVSNMLASPIRPASKNGTEHTHQPTVLSLAWRLATAGTLPQAS